MGRRPNDPSKLSTKPAQIKNRIRKREKPLQQDINLYIEHVYKKPIEEWDLEELGRGRPRDKNGSFTGAAPKWITATVAQEAKRRLLTETFGELAGHAQTAVKVIVNLMTSTEVDEKGKPIVDPRTQLAAATFILEHILGKPKAVVDIGGEDFVRSALASAIILDDGMPQGHLVIEGEYEEVDDDDDVEEM